MGLWAKPFQPEESCMDGEEMQWREGATRLFIPSRRLVLVLAVLLARYLEVVGLPPFVSVVLHTSLSVSRYRFVSVVMVFLSSSDLHRPSFLPSSCSAGSLFSRGAPPIDLLSWPIITMSCRPLAVVMAAGATGSGKRHTSWLGVACWPTCKYLKARMVVKEK